MEKLAEKEYGYQFFKEDNNYYLSVLVGTCFMYIVDIKLTPVEKKQYNQEGVVFIEKLAADITRFPNNYTLRRLSLSNEFYDK